ncbi:MAG: hypothetical protein KJS79_06860 [Rhodospirillales bacterium]|nr:hypothetical protein [Rhodospirillales bacterium]
MKALDRRIAAIEARTGDIALPHHLPPEQWTDDQLARLATGRRVKAASLTDADLIELAADD